MKAAIYNPYLDTLGGGERYTMAFANTLVNKGYQVDVQWKNQSIKKKLENRFGLKFGVVNLTSDIRRGDGYDVCFWVSDGSIPMLRARQNFLHFQIPFVNVNGKSLLNKMKLFRINALICNSYFTKSFIDEEYGMSSIVIYPPVDVENIKPKRKENLILSVNRFSQLVQAKRQDVLVDSFKKLYKRGFSDWRLVLAGGVEVGVTDFVTSLRRTSSGYPIEIIESPNFTELKKLYGKAKIFWSASGYGVNERRDPKSVEHFGITVVEAMAGGAVPLAFQSGGHKEIVSEEFNGFLWKSERELVKKTAVVIKDGRNLRKLSEEARESSLVYEYERFETEVSQLLG